VASLAASAPGRCGLIGNPSDLYGGFVVSCSVPLRNSCRLFPGANRTEDCLWSAAIARFPLDGWAYEWTSRVPRSSGLAGSTALLAATLHCILAARGEAPALETHGQKAAFAELVRDVEHREAGVVCGFQDAYMAVFGGLQAMDFSGKGPLDPGPPAQVASIQAHLPFLLVSTGVERLSGSVHAPVRDRWLAGDEPVRRSIERIAELGRAGAGLLERGDWPALAEAMRENQHWVADMGGSGEAVDALVGACQGAGALAAKLAGAGHGGTVVALHPEPDRLEASLRTKGYETFLRPQIVSGLEARGENS
jgi:galactokinase/mevalonate kinase-like predicted kinase